MVRWACVAALAMLLAGCSTCCRYQPLSVSQQPHSALWLEPSAIPPDRAARNRRQALPGAQPTKDAEAIRSAEARLATLAPHSTEWWSAFEALERSRDAKMSKVLVICSNCLDPTVKTAAATLVVRRAHALKVDEESHVGSIDKAKDGSCAPK